MPVAGEEGVRRSMAACDEQPLLSAFHDGELDEASAHRVEAHLARCAACAAELSAMRDLSLKLHAYPLVDINPAEMGRLHDAVARASAEAQDEAGGDADRTVWRIGGTLGLVAASMLIIGLAWLKAMPASRPAGPTSVVTAPATSWERMAMTLRPGPLDALPRASEPQEIQLALTEWHMEALGAGLASR